MTDTKWLSELSAEIKEIQARHADCDPDYCDPDIKKLLGHIVALEARNADLVGALNKISIESDCDDIIKIATDALARNGGKP